MCMERTMIHYMAKKCALSNVRNGNVVSGEMKQKMVELIGSEL